MPYPLQAAPNANHTDEFSGPWALLLLVVALAGMAAYAWLTTMKPWRSYLLSAEHRAILAKYAISYQRLLPEQRKRMERIVAAFVNDKEWTGAGIEVAEEMKVMISACAAQLLMGYPGIRMKHFERFVVFPDSYRDRRTGRQHQGEVRPASGTIVISWDDFVNGYAHTRDAHNVGLHELAHALWFENRIDNGEHGFLPENFLRQWRTEAQEEILRIKRGEGGFFRDYAGANEAELFAVAVEYFFEQPLEFRDAEPRLYALLTSILRQDPATATHLN